MDLFLESPIPLEFLPLSGWKDVPIQENGESLVALGSFSNSVEIFTHGIYFGEKADSPYSFGSLNGGLITMFVRQGVAEQLKEAQRRLTKGMHLIVYDAYRTLAVQQSLYDQYFSGLKTFHFTWTKDQLSSETQKFVSIPSVNPCQPSPHNTGGAVDVAIFKLPEKIEIVVQKIDQELVQLGEKSWQRVYQLEMRKIGLIEMNMQLLDFGTRFDFAGIEASVNYFEKLAVVRKLSSKEEEIQKNRRLLYNLMKAVGFEPYEDEWWHYNSKKSQMGAKIAGLNYAEYGPIALSADNLEYEKMRSGHWLGSIKIFEKGISPEKSAAEAGVLEVGDIRKTKSPSKSHCP
ncbi:MAG: D-alanyl-D-alanine carboxypeptidase family protein, partial [Patescibacteria group bacterium]|nr:D-alanyl-D-alanine carboxypeptidase family protein [Patescibacteria group bacterium]